MYCFIKCIQTTVDTWPMRVCRSMSICWCENPVHLGNRSSVQRHDMGRMGRGEKTTAVLWECFGE